MSLPRFIERAGDAAVPLLAGAGREAFLQRLNETVVTLVCADSAAADRSKRDGYLLTVNLAARLYPKLILTAPAELLADARALAISINPGVELLEDESAGTATLHYGGEYPAHGVLVDAVGWHALVDRDDVTPGPAAAPAALAAAALGCAELFRIVFADELGPRGRTGPQPGGFNLVTLEAWSDEELPLANVIDVGSVHLAGCGAVAEAAGLTFSAYPTKGTLYAVDHEVTDVSNTQRYVGMFDADVGAGKPGLITRLVAASELDVIEVPARWGEDARAHPGAETVLTALDTLGARIEVQAGLPRVIYNAWTQSGDLGWSRHERFGEEQCLACLCWPRGRKTDRYQLIAKALGQHPLRVGSYLGTGQPVGTPLAAIQGTLRHRPPDGAGQWTERSILEDILADRELAPGADLAAWSGRSIEELYRDGVCGGGLIRQDGFAEAEVEVPLAHQSVLAGVMLATQLLVAKHDPLRAARAAATEARYDVLTGFAQVLPRPSTRYGGCICVDPDYVAAYAARTGAADHSALPPLRTESVST